MKVIGKRKPFKTNNSSEVLYGLHISNSPTMGGETCDERFGRKLHSNSCHSQFVLNTILLSRRALFAAQHYCEWLDHFTPSISIGSITRGRNVVNAYEKL